MKHACQYCGRIHEGRNACGKAPTKQRQHGSDNEARRLRNKQAWRRAKLEANTRDKMMCVLCLREGRLTYDGLETHHIVPLSIDPERAYDVDNLVTLCRAHHEWAESIPPTDLIKILRDPCNRRSAHEKK